MEAEMTEALLLIVGLAVGVAVTLIVRRRRGEERDMSGRRILFPYVGTPHAGNR